MTKYDYVRSIFHFFDFFKYLKLISNFGQLNVDRHWNKFKHEIWKTKTRSFLVTSKWSLDTLSNFSKPRWVPPNPIWTMIVELTLALNCSRPIVPLERTCRQTRGDPQEAHSAIWLDARVGLGLYPLTSGPRRTQWGFWLAHPHLPQWHKMGILAHQMGILAVTRHRNLNGDFGTPNGDSHELGQI